MTRIRSAALAAALLPLLAAPSLATAMSPHGLGGKGRPEFLQELFSPRLVMRHQTAIELTPTQRGAISKAMAETQARVVEIQWRLAEQSAALEKLLAEPRVDRAAALAQAARVMRIEEEMKTAHLALLIEIKNTLEPAQQTKLRELRGREGWGGRRRGLGGRRGFGGGPSPELSPPPGGSPPEDGR